MTITPRTVVKIQPQQNGRTGVVSASSVAFAANLQTWRPDFRRLEDVKLMVYGGRCRSIQPLATQCEAVCLSVCFWLTPGGEEESPGPVRDEKRPGRIRRLDPCPDSYLSSCLGPCLAPYLSPCLGPCPDSYLSPCLCPCLAPCLGLLPRSVPLSVPLSVPRPVPRSVPQSVSPSLPRPVPRPVPRSVSRPMPRPVPRSLSQAGCIDGRRELWQQADLPDWVGRSSLVSRSD